MCITTTYVWTFNLKADRRWKATIQSTKQGTLLESSVKGASNTFSLTPSELSFSKLKELHRICPSLSCCLQMWSSTLSVVNMCDVCVRDSVLKLNVQQCMCGMEEQQQMKKCDSCLWPPSAQDPPKREIHPKRNAATVPGWNYSSTQPAQLIPVFRLCLSATPVLWINEWELKLMGEIWFNERMNWKKRRGSL